MNEELLKRIYENRGYKDKGTYDEFKADMLSSQELRKRVFAANGYDKKGTFEEFETDLALPSQHLPALPEYKAGPVGVARPGVMANPGQDNEKLKDFYAKENSKGGLANAMLLAGPARESMQLSPAQNKALAEVGKGAQAEAEVKAAELLNADGDVLSVAKKIWSVDYDKKKEKYSKDPQIAEAEFSFEALDHYRQQAKLVDSRSRERLKAMHGDKYGAAEIEKAIDKYTALSLMGDGTEATAYIKNNFPELLGDPNLNNIFTANQKLRDVAIADNHIFKNNPRVLERGRKAQAEQEKVDKQAAEFKENSFKYGFIHPSLPNLVKARIGGWTKNIAFTPGMRDTGRDMMDFNPQSSDFQGRAVENFKEVKVGGKNYDVVYDGDKLAYVRDADTGFMVRPDDAQMKEINAAASKASLNKRWNPKPFVGQLTSTVVDMAPIIAISAATGGIGSTLGISSGIARGIGVVAGSALQTRGDIMDQMLLHPDISKTEAELYTGFIGMGIGALSLLNPIEARGLVAALPSILKKNAAKLLSKQITKGQYAWEVVKDTTALAVKETGEELGQEWFQYGALNAIDSKEGMGNFHNHKPTGDDMLEIAMVSSAVAVLMGRGDIRKTRNAMIDDALSHALDNPKLVDAYLTEMETGASLIQDETKQKEALEHVQLTRERWESVKANTDSVKGLKSRDRGKLVGLIADANALEEELGKITSEPLRKAKEAEVKEINAQIEALINKKTPAAETETDEIDLEDPEYATEEDMDRAATTNIGLLDDSGAETEIDYFEEDQRIENEKGTGSIIKVNHNQDESIHSIKIKYDDESIPDETVTVFRKTPAETGIKVLKNEGKKSTDQQEGTGAQATDGTDAKGPDTEGSGTEETGSKLPDDETSTEEKEDPALTAQIAKETARLTAQRDQDLKDLDEFAALDPDYDKAGEQKKIEDRYQANIKKANVTARKALINNQRSVDIKKAKDYGKKKGVNVDGTIDRINKKYDAMISDVDKKYGSPPAGKPKPTEGDSGYGVKPGQEKEDLAPSKDFDKHPNFKAVKEKYDNSPNKAYGKKISRVLPNGEKVTGKYVLVNKKDIAASHLPNSFAKTPGVPVTPTGNTFNTNDYENNPRAQAKAIKDSKKFDQRAIDNLVFVDSNGIVKSGNGRTIARNMSTAESAKEYLDALKERAEEFGFTQEQIAAIGDEDVMLAVELEGDPVYNSQEYAKFNKNGEKDMTPLQETIAMAKTIGEKTIAKIAGIFEQSDVMSDLSKADILSIRDTLLAEGIINDTEVPKYFDENDKLTPAGAEFIENILLSSVFNENELKILALNPGVRKKLSQNRVRLLKNKQRGDLSVVPKIRQALYMIQSARQSDGKDFEEKLLTFITQGSLLSPAGNYDLETIAIALALNNTTILRNILDRLNTYQADPLFGTSFTSEQIIANTFEKINQELNEGAKKVLKAAAAITRTEGATSPPPTDGGDIGVDGQQDTGINEENDEGVPGQEGEEGEVAKPKRMTGEDAVSRLRSLVQRSSLIRDPAKARQDVEIFAEMPDRVVDAFEKLEIAKDLYGPEFKKFATEHEYEALQIFLFNPGGAETLFDDTITEREEFIKSTTEYLKTVKDPKSKKMWEDAIASAVRTIAELKIKKAEYLGTSTKPKPPAPEVKKPVGKKAQRKIRDAETDKELDSALDELRAAIKKPPLTTGGIDPELIIKGSKVISIYVKKGIYKFTDIIEDLYVKLGDETQEMFSALRQAYGAYINDAATDDQATQMDQSVRGFKYENIIANIETETEEEESAGAPDTGIQVTSFAKGSGGTQGILQGPNGQLYKSEQPMQLIYTEEKGSQRIPIEGKTTEEYQILSELQDNPNVPKIGARVQTSEGPAFEIETLEEIQKFTPAEYNQIQDILNDLNDKGYYVGDFVTVMRRPSTGELVVVDFSHGYKQDPADTSRIPSRDVTRMQEIERKMNTGDVDEARKLRAKAKKEKGEWIDQTQDEFISDRIRDAIADFKDMASIKDTTPGKSWNDKVRDHVTNLLRQEYEDLRRSALRDKKLPNRYKRTEELTAEEYFEKEQERFLESGYPFNYDEKVSRDEHKEEVGAAIKSEYYQEAIADGRMTAEDAKAIIESVGLPLPEFLATKEPEPLVNDTLETLKEKLKSPWGKKIVINGVQYTITNRGTGFGSPDITMVDAAGNIFYIETKTADGRTIRRLPTETTLKDLVREQKTETPETPPVKFNWDNLDAQPTPVLLSRLADVISDMGSERGNELEQLIRRRGNLQSLLTKRGLDLLTIEEQDALPAHQKGKLFRGEDSRLQDLDLADGDTVRDSYNGQEYTVKKLSPDEAKAEHKARSWRYNDQWTHYLLTGADGKVTMEGERPIFQRISPAKPKAKTVKPHKETILSKFRKVFSEKGIPSEQIDTAIAVMEARATSWASMEEGRDPDDWFDRIADIKDGEIIEDTGPKKPEGGTGAGPKAPPKKDDLLDVGEKIGGAKKDIAKALKDLYAITTTEIESQPLSKVFPEPDYKKLVADGSMTQSEAIFLKYLYSHIPTKPKKRWRMSSWVEKVDLVITLFKNVLSGEWKGVDLVQKMGENYYTRDLLESDFPIFSDTLIGIDFPASGLKLGHFKIKRYVSMYKKDPETGEYKNFKGPFFVIFNGKSQLPGFEYGTVEEAAAKLKELLSNKEPQKKEKKEVKFSFYKDRETKEFFIAVKVKGDVVRVMDGFETSKQMYDYYEAHKDELIAIWEGMTRVPEERRATNRKRIGTDWREGKDIPSEDFRSKFGFRGVEFGNWVNIRERQMHVNEAYDALMDLATSLNVSPKALSLNGELAFAFGARGSGKASAHYESGKIVINLTKKKGAGSLAHEWWHAVDNYFARIAKNKHSFATQGNAMNQSVRGDMIRAFENLTRVIRMSNLPKRSKILDRGRSQPYWSTMVEMTARSFESFIIGKLAETKHLNDYLANFRDAGEWAGLMGGGIDATQNYPYPLQEEIHVVHEAYQQFFDTINEDENARLFQENKGAVETLEDGRKVIIALKSPDFSTMMHELGHIFYEDLTDTDREIVDNHSNGDPEFFPRAFERYLRDGEAPTEALQSMFEKFKQWLTDIYQSLIGSPIERALDPEIKKIFDGLLTEKRELPKAYSIDKDGNIIVVKIVLPGETTTQVELDNGNRTIRANTEIFNTPEEAQARIDSTKEPVETDDQIEARIRANIERAKKEPYPSPDPEIKKLQDKLGMAPKPPVKKPVVSDEKKEKRKVRDEKFDKAIDDDLDALRNALKNNSNLTVGGINPDALAIATGLVGKYIKKGVYKFSDIVEDLYAKIGDDLEGFFGAIKAAYGAYINSEATDQEADQMDQNIRNFTYESLTSKFKDDVSDQPGDSTEDSADVTDTSNGDPGDVPGGDGGRSGGTGNGNEGSDLDQDEERTDRPGDGNLLTPPIGEQTDLFTDPTDGKPKPPKGGPGSTDGRGNSITGTKGSDADGSGGKGIDPGTKGASRSFREREQLAFIEQQKAEPIEAVLMDPDNIRATLPYLLPDQQDDVIKAETRFFSPEHKVPAKANGKGMMFTNGTGTGKTFVGLGIIKRFVKQGKGRVLIVTPSQPKVEDWKKDALKLGLKVTSLDGINDGGRDINVTTFANFRANEELLKHDFDLIVYDESHRIMEAKGGKESNTTAVHQMMGNKDELSALRRLQRTHPLWKQEIELRAKLIDAQNRPYTDPNWINKDRDIRAIQEELMEVREEQIRLTPAMKVRARAAVEKTKVVFLSATPFKEHFNLEYANGFLFDWGDEEVIRNGSRVSAKGQFYMEHFGGAYEWKFHRLQQRAGANADAIAMQEVAFSEKLKKDGVMSGKVIDSEKDYSREFPKVTGFNAEEFNMAFNDIFNYDNGAFNLLREPAEEIFYNYQYTTQLFESLKASMGIDRIKKHIELGRKVVVFHRRKMAEATPPFESVYDNAIAKSEYILANPFSLPADRQKAIYMAEQAEAFKEKYATLFEYEQTLDYRTALEQIESAFPGRVGYINGDISNKKKGEAIKQFNTDDSDIDIIVVQEEAGKEGISLHDTTGKHQRVLINLSMPISTTTALQIEGRIYRLGQESNAIFEYLLLGLDLEVAYFGMNLNRRLSTTENMAMGENSRDLIRSYAEGVLFNSTTDDPHEDQGQGGKEYDKKVAAQQNEFQKAKMIYATNQNIRDNRKNREGEDYYATPEPLGQKMVEWADTKAGDQVLEPSAGHGAIAMWFPTNTTTTSIESSFTLYSKLNGRAGGGTRKVLNQRFEDHAINNKYDAIVMNPPFGTAGKLAMEHIEKAWTHLREGGRLVALVPVGQMDKRIEDFLYGVDEKGRQKHPEAHLRKEILLPSSTFQQAGTTVNTRVIIIDKVPTRYEGPQNEGTVDITSARTTNELFDRIEFLEVPPRAVLEQPASNPYGEPVTPPVGLVRKVLMAPAVAVTLPGTNQTMYSVKATRFLGNEYKAINQIAIDTYKGGYSRSTTSFLFPTLEQAEGFRFEINSKDAAQASFSMQEAEMDAETAIKSGNPNPNAPLIIRLKEAQATPEQRMYEYAHVWLDVIKEKHKAFYDRGIQLVKDPKWAALVKDGDYHGALATMIGTTAARTKLSPGILAWVKNFWTRLGKLMGLNVTPEQLQNLTIEEYALIAGLQLRYGNEIYVALATDSGQSTDTQAPPTPSPDPAKPPTKPVKPVKPQEKVTQELEDMVKDPKGNHPDPPKRPSKPLQVPADKEFEFLARDLDAKTDPVGNPKGETIQRLLREYSGPKRRLIETALLIWPTLKHAGITITFHESQDSYANAVVNIGNGGLMHAVNSGGFYRNKQVHINLSRAKLNENTALHEAFHPIIRDILVNNKPIFNRFVNDLMTDPVMKQKYIEEFGGKYKHLGEDEDAKNAINEEALVEASADIVMRRILSLMKSMPETIFDRVLTYIKEALGASYGALYQFVNTRESFTAFAESMADAIGRGMVIPFHVVADENIKTFMNESIANYSMQTDREEQKRKILDTLEHRVLTNPEVNYEPIAEMLIRTGKVTKGEVDDILFAWRSARDRKLGSDARQSQLEDMAELRRRRRLDETANMMVKKATMKEIIESGILHGIDGLTKAYSSRKIQRMVESVIESGDHHPQNIIELLDMSNEKERPVGARDYIAVAIAINSMRQAKTAYMEIVARTGDVAASQAIQELDRQMSHLANAADLSRSLSGLALGIGSKLLRLAGMTYESELRKLHAINESAAGRDIEVDPADITTLERLVKEKNLLQKQLDEAILSANPKDAKATAAANAHNTRIRTGLEARPIMTKDEALEQLRRLKARRSSFSLALSIDEDEEGLSYFDVINQLVKIAHLEITDEVMDAAAETPPRKVPKGFKEVVKRVMSYDPTITEDDIYKAVLSTTPQAQQKALSEYAKVQAVTRKHVKDINKVEQMITKAASNLLRTQALPDESAINEFGKIMKDIERNIYNLDANPELMNTWKNALDIIRTNYALAFVGPGQENSELMISKMINATQILKDNKFRAWLEKKNAELDEQIALIKEGRISELIEQEDITYKKYPTQMMAPVIDPDTGGFKYDKEGNVLLEQVDYDFGHMDRMVRDKEREIENLKAKYRKSNPWFVTLYKVGRGTFGTAMAMADLSYFAIQGIKMAATLGLRNPKIFYKAFTTSLRTMQDEFRKNPGLYNKTHIELTNNPYYNIAMAVDLTLTSPDAHVYVNEMMSEDDLFDMGYDSLKGSKTWVGKGLSKGLGFRKKLKLASNAAFATHLNMLSMNSFAAYIENTIAATGEMPSMESLKAIAAEINNATGRPAIARKATDVASYVFWAPKLYLSQILNFGNIVADPINLAVHMIREKNARANGNIKLADSQKDMVRAYGHRTVNSAIFAASLTGIYLLRVFLAKLQCGEHAAINTDASKPSFLKIQCGELTLDPTGNIRQWIALGGRLIAAADGKPYVDFTGQRVSSKEQISNMLEYKLNPLVSIMWQEWDAVDFLGRPRIPGDESFLLWRSRGAIILDHLKPIAAGNVVGIAQAKGLDGPVPPVVTKPLTMVEAILGFGVNRIDTEKEAERNAKMKEVKQKEKAAQTQKAKKVMIDTYGKIEELEGEFESALPIGAIEPTKGKYTDKSGTYRVFHRTDDPGSPGNGIDDDYYVVKKRGSGKNKGKKHLDRIEDLKRIKGLDL